MSYRYDWYTDSFVHIPAAFQQGRSLTIDLDGVDEIVVIKNGTRFPLEEYIKLVIADALSDVNTKGEQE